MKLYEIPNKSKIYLDEGQSASDGSSYLIYDHPDGMYSYCITENKNVAHLFIGTEVEVFEDGYKISKKEQ